MNVSFAASDGICVLTRRPQEYGSTGETFAALVAKSGTPFGMLIVEPWRYELLVRIDMPFDYEHSRALSLLPNALRLLGACLDPFAGLRPVTVLTSPSDVATADACLRAGFVPDGLLYFQDLFADGDPTASFVQDVFSARYTRQPADYAQDSDS